MTRYVPGRQNIWIAEIDLLNFAKNTAQHNAADRRFTVLGDLPSLASSERHRTLPDSFPIAMMRVHIGAYANG